MTASASRIAFVHIPRTAGTAFGEHLDRLHAGARIAKFYVDDEHPVVNGRINAYRALDEAEKASYAMLRGHFPYGFDDSERGSRYVTLLREPVSRLVSYYFYALKEPLNYLHAYLFQRRIGLERFLASDASIDLDNAQVRAISGAHFDSPRDRVGPEHLEMAKHNLVERFAAFGLTERFDESMRRFSSRFEWPAAGVQRRNEGSYARDLTLSPSCREHVEHTNRFDIELYRFALERFDLEAAPPAPTDRNCGRHPDTTRS
ncbi:sulfotransferase family 2 domain-containing protein [Burkholderia sp. SIMBA_062]|uniref:sulfotransferase family 2 domain-containing protein n=1 Tax=Burkholderia sp. SIMBA_062 TaxID=3085803 RepID=UPI00397885ED